MNELDCKNCGLRFRSVSLSYHTDVVQSYERRLFRMRVIAVILAVILAATNIGWYWVMQRPKPEEEPFQSDMGHFNH